MNKLYLVSEVHNKYIQGKLYDKSKYLFNEGKTEQVFGIDCIGILTYLDLFTYDLHIGFIGVDNKVFRKDRISSFPTSVLQDLSYHIGLEVDSFV